MTNHPDLLSKSARLKGLRGGKVAFAAVPTPVLMGKEQVYSPNRTNYFPFSQLILASSLLERLEGANIPWTVSLYDFKSIADIHEWDQDLHEYGELDYGGLKLTKCIIGDGLARAKAELSEVDILCISANFTFEANIMIKFIETVKTVNRHCLIIMGGQDAAARAGFYLAKGADMVALGEADFLLPELMVRLYQGTDYADICHDGTMAAPQGVINLNELPLLRFDLISGREGRYVESGGGGYFESITKKGMVAYYETSRGCYRECDFCTGRLKKMSAVSLARYFEDIKWYKQCGIATLMFSDDNLLQRLNQGAAGEEELVLMFDYLKKEKMIWEFPVGLEMGKFVDPKTSQIKESLFKALLWSNDSVRDFSGAFRILFPVENALGEEKNDHKFTYSKLKDSEIYDLVLQHMIGAGIPQINLGIMVGWPNESKKTIRNIEAKIDQYQTTCNRINESKYTDIKTKINYSIFCLTPLPGTPMYQQMEQEHRIKYDIEKDPELWNLYTSVLAGDVYEPAEITKIRLDILSKCESEQRNGKVQLHQKNILQSPPISFNR